jgi:magnesium transporter
MYLTDKKLGVERKLEDHDELEVLLESFDKQVEEIVNEAETTIVSLSPNQLHFSPVMLCHSSCILLFLVRVSGV